jgi:predicted nucleic acid-binding protein
VTFLTDANVISEVTRPEPDLRVLDWLRLNEREIVVDPIIVGEIQFGILLLSKGRKRQRLELWFSAVVTEIICLPWETATAMNWAKLLADLRRKGRSMPIKDSMIAATALTHDLTVVTRNGRDFKKAGLRVVNPFEKS